DVSEGLDGEFDKQKRFGDEVVAAGHHGAGAAVETAQRGDEDDGGLFVLRQSAQFGAEFVAGHDGHVHVEEHQVEMFFPEQLEGGVRVLDAEGLEVGLLEGVDDGAAGNRLVVHDQDVAGGDFLSFGRDTTAKKKAEKVHAGGNGAERGRIDVLRFFVKLL